MSGRHHLIDGKERLYAIIESVVRAGIPMPTNEELAGKLGCSSIATPARLLSRLEAEGRVQVTRYQTARAVYLPALRASALSQRQGGRPHWRYREKTQPKVEAAVKARPVAPVVAEPARVFRDPCFKCGVRGDIGCSHQPRSAA